MVRSDFTMTMRSACSTGCRWGRSAAQLEAKSKAPAETMRSVRRMHPECFDFAQAFTISVRSGGGLHTLDGFVDARIDADFVVTAVGQVFQREVAWVYVGDAAFSHHDTME